MLILGLVKKAIFSLSSKQEKNEVNKIMPTFPPPPPKNMVSLFWLMVSICYLCTELVFYLSTRNFQKLLNLTIYFWQHSIEHNYYFWNPRWKLYTTHWTSVIVNSKKVSQDKFCNGKFTLVGFANNVYKNDGEKSRQLWKQSPKKRLLERKFQYYWGIPRESVLPAIYMYYIKQTIYAHRLVLTNWHIIWTS